MISCLTEQLAGGGAGCMVAMVTKHLYKLRRPGNVTKDILGKIPAH